MRKDAKTGVLLIFREQKGASLRMLLKQKILSDYSVFT